MAGLVSGKVAYAATVGAGFDVSRPVDGASRVFGGLGDGFQPVPVIDGCFARVGGSSGAGGGWSVCPAACVGVDGIAGCWCRLTRYGVGLSLIPL